MKIGTLTVLTKEDREFDGNVTNSECSFASEIL